MVSTHLLRLQSIGKDSIFLIPTEFPEDSSQEDEIQFPSISRWSQQDYNVRKKDLISC